MRLLDQRQVFGRRTLAEVQDYQATCLADRAVPITLTGQVLDAYVEHGRWLAYCPHCLSGIALWDDNPGALCLGCGWAFDVRWPTNANEIETLLWRRPLEHQHYLPGDTVETLRAENDLLLVERRHSVPADPRRYGL